MISKRGEEKYLSIWWFFVLIIVGVWIVIGVLRFYSINADIRILESEILFENIRDCLSENGYFVDRKLSECFISIPNNSKFFVFASMNGNVLFKEGDFSLESDCKIQGILQGKKAVSGYYLPVCYYEKKKVYMASINGVSEVELEILVASNQNKGGEII